MLNVIAFLLLSGFVDPPASPAEIVKALEQGCTKNLSSLSYGTIGFERSVGTAATLTDAVAGVWTSRFSTKGDCAFDGQRVRYNCVFSLEAMVDSRTKIAPGRWKPLFVSGRYATDGSKTLYDVLFPNEDGTVVESTSQITEGSRAVGAFMIMPLNLGNPQVVPRFLSDARQLEKASSLEKLSIVSVTKGDGKVPPGLVEVRFRGEPLGANKGSRELRCRIDPSHGSIPVELEESTTTPKGQFQYWTIHDDVRLVGEGRWLPYRFLSFDVQRGVVDEVRITSADFDTRPPAESFAIRYDRPRNIIDQVRFATYENVSDLNILKLPTSAKPIPWKGLIRQEPAPDGR